MATKGRGRTGKQTGGSRTRSGGRSSPAPSRGGRKGGRPGNAKGARGRSAPERKAPPPSRGPSRYARGENRKPGAPKAARPAAKRTPPARKSPSAPVHVSRAPSTGTDSLIYGLRSVATQLKADPQRVVRVMVDEERCQDRAVTQVVEQAEQLGIRVQRASRDELARASRGAVHQGVMAEVSAFKYADVDDLVDSSEPALLLVLDEVTDPQNLGAAARAAWALGGTGMILPKDRSAPVNAAAEKVAAGALAHLKVSTVTNLARTLGDLKKHGVWVIGLDVDGPVPLYDQDLTGPVALVVGSEGTGMRRLTKELCDAVVSIPMANDEAALNAADAAAVALYEAARQRTMVAEEEE